MTFKVDWTILYKILFFILESHDTNMFCLIVKSSSPMETICYVSVAKMCLACMYIPPALRKIPHSAFATI